MIFYSGYFLEFFVEIFFFSFCIRFCRLFKSFSIFGLEFLFFVGRVGSGDFEGFFRVCDFRWKFSIFR